MKEKFLEIQGLRKLTTQKPFLKECHENILKQNEKEIKSRRHGLGLKH